MAFDADTGLLTCEAGVLLFEIIETFLPRGWFPTVTPGTKFITVGGAIAADTVAKTISHRRLLRDTVESFVLMRRMERPFSAPKRKTGDLSGNLRWNGIDRSHSEGKFSPEKSVLPVHRTDHHKNQEPGTNLDGV
ncbi:MAG: hypothetical protein U5K27_13755 [Desulfotignum sp.]|nr:hypothetical protein [Desulfotignum sp.]